MPNSRTKRASRVWLVAAVISIAVAVIAGTVAFRNHAASTRPIGEGQLFLEDATVAADAVAVALADGADLDLAVRGVRNDLRIEAVSLVASSGTYVASTSPNLVGTALADPFLGFSLSEGRFGAIAKPIDLGLQIDGVAAWSPSDVLYQVVYPIDGADHGISLHYDVVELLSRRLAAAGVRPFTLRLAGAAVLALLATVGLLWARSVAQRRIRRTELVARHHAERSIELEIHNRRLDEARARAERALELAEEVNRVRTEFVLMINHELRTPLTSVVTGAELLRDDSINATDAASIIDDMIRDGNRLMELIGQMLSVARIENQGLDYTLRPTSVADVLSVVGGSTSAATVGKSSPAVAAAVVSTDRDGLAQLLASLAENAQTHGAENVEITAESRSPVTGQALVGTVPAEAIHFVVTDDGPGIDPAFLPRIFEKYEKHSFSSGTGLRLYLARLIVEAIDGSIVVATSPAGTTFVASVPIAVARMEAA